MLQLMQRNQNAFNPKIVVLDDTKDKKDDFSK